MEHARVAVLLVALLPAILSCSSHDGMAEYCLAREGCANERFVAAVISKCGRQVTNCRLSFREIIGDVERVYLIERLGARLDECTTIPVSKSLKRSYTPLCQYIIFEKKGEVASYLRGFCTSEVKISGDELGFESGEGGYVTVMDARESILINVVDTKDMQGNEKRFYQIELAPSSINTLDPRKEKCIGPH